MSLETYKVFAMPTNEQERNLRIAEAVCRDFEWHGQKFREGQYLALLDGKIVAVADNADDAIAALRSLDPDPKHGMVVPVETPAMDVIR
jgi:dihydroxyacetone kinase-like predicted kinase